MPQPFQTPLLKTRARTAVAVGVTALLFALAVRGGLHPYHARTGWLVPFGFLVHRWALLAANIAFYGYLCWLGFWFVRGTAGLERVFIAAWFVNILVSPLERLWPQWLVAIRHISIFGLGVALLAGISLLLNRSEAADSEQQN